MSMSQTVKILDALETLRDACHRNAKEKGFWDEEEEEEEVAPNIYINTKSWNFGEKIALIHSELSEMFEAWRKNIMESEKDITIIDPRSPDIDNEGVPTGIRRITAIEEEIADVFIRLMDLCGKMEIDVGRIVLAKMEYNAGRSHMHGGRKC